MCSNRLRQGVRSPPHCHREHESEISKAGRGGAQRRAVRRPKNAQQETCKSGENISEDHAARAVELLGFRDQNEQRPRVHRNVYEPAMQKPGRNQAPPLVERIDEVWVLIAEQRRNARVQRSGRGAKNSVAQNQLCQIQRSIDDQKNSRCDVTARNKRCGELARSRIDNARSQLHAAVRAHPVTHANEGPAIGAHSPLFHGLIVAATQLLPDKMRERMSKTEQEYRHDLIRVCHRIYEKGWVAMNDGNVSIRLDTNRVLCTPTAVSKGFVELEDLIIVDMNGRIVEGRRECTSEIAMHITIYSMRPDVRSVVHAHPPVATGFASAGRALDKALLPEVVINLGAVPLAAYGLPGTPALSDGMRPLIPYYDALLLQNHGCTSYGADVWQAFFRMEIVEHFARITFVAEMLGGARALPREEVEKLFASRARYNVTSNAPMEPGMPLVAEDLVETKR